jgi:hypothetical protein
MYQAFLIVIKFAFKHNYLSSFEYNVEINSKYYMQLLLLRLFQLNQFKRRML